MVASCKRLHCMLLWQTLDVPRKKNCGAHSPFRQQKMRQTTATLTFCISCWCVGCASFKGRASERTFLLDLPYALLSV